MLALTCDGPAMLDGKQGAATRKAMELLVRYAEVLRAERFVEISNVAGVPGSSTQWHKDHQEGALGTSRSYSCG